MAEDPDNKADGYPRSRDEPYSLGQTAEDAYNELSTGREAILEQGREMCSLTIPEVMPPEGWVPGDKVPGNNQSIGASAHAHLAAVISYMAFPPGQPMARFEPIEYAVQKKVAEDPEQWQAMQLGLSRLEQIHRKKAAAIQISGIWEQFCMLLLGAGNGLWKHIRLRCPSFHRPDCYVVQRDAGGQQLVAIHKETIRLVTLDGDLQSFILEYTPDLAEEPEWTREVDVYSVCRLRRKPGSGEDEWYWEYWQEYKGQNLPGTDFEADFDDCPMSAEWLIPAYGHNWGLGYLYRYRGDLYTVEAAGSSLNDGAAQAGWSMMFVKPGGQTNIRQVTKAPNLSILPGLGTDITFPVTNKSADMNFVGGNQEKAARRIGIAFLQKTAIQREGERVTAEELRQLGNELDKATGGLYTLVAQGPQLRMVKRFIHLHEEEGKNVPKLPPGVVEVQPVTGVDAMGRSLEDQALTEVLTEVLTVDKSGESSKRIDWGGVLKAKFAAKGVKPDGLVKSEEKVGQETDAARKQAMQQDLLSKAAGPLAGAAGKMMGEGGMPVPPMDEGSQPPVQPGPQGAAPPG